MNASTSLAEYAVILGGIIGLLIHSTSPGSGIAMSCFSKATSSHADRLACGRENMAKLAQYSAGLFRELKQLTEQPTEFRQTHSCRRDHSFRQL
ncbi:hypothetical protein [Mesorhizobium sp. M1273]|uniref:hypothetical protein n=1 Tax=Mesorhizobium sp. M1273 TaxID=2957075 RepID=UPI00333942F2